MTMLWFELMSAVASVLLGGAVTLFAAVAIYYFLKETKTD